MQFRANMSNPGGVLAQRRAVVSGKCRSCGKLMTGIKIKRYCSATCRQRAFRARVKGQETVNQGDKS